MSPKTKKRTDKNDQIMRERLVGIEAIDKGMAGLFILAVVILPLLIRMHTGQFIAPRFIADPVNTGIQGEVFTYYKTVFLYLLALAALFLLLAKIFLYRWEIRSSYINIPIMILALAIFLSGILAEYKGIAIFGMYNRREGTLTYLAYLLIFFAAAHTSYKPWFERIIKWGLGLVVLVNMVIILFHFYGHDLFQSAAVRALLIPAGLQGANASGTLWSTLNNPNYVSGFAAALAVFYLVLAIRGIDWKERIIWSAASALAFAMMLAALSTSGWAALFLTLPLLIVVVCKSKELRAALLTGGINIGIWILVFVILNSYNPAVSSEPMIFLQTTLSKTINEIKSPADQPGPEPIGGIVHETGIRSAASSDGEAAADEFSLPASGSSAGSGRTYIWRKTGELIKARPLLGYGLDTLVYHFPQNDPGKIAGLRTMDRIVDKPHSAYLGIAYGSGLIALAAMLCLLVLYLYNTGRGLLSRPGNSDTGFQAALLAFSLAFMIQCLFNDSIIGTSVIFWTLLGISVSLNSPTD